MPGVVALISFMNLFTLSIKLLSVRYSIPSGVTLMHIFKNLISYNPDIIFFHSSFLSSGSILMASSDMTSMCNDDGTTYRS